MVDRLVNGVGAVLNQDFTGMQSDPPLNLETDTNLNTRPARAAFNCWRRRVGCTPMMIVQPRNKRYKPRNVGGMFFNWRAYTYT